MKRTNFFDSGAVTISDFHYMISVDDIHGNNIITTSVEYILLSYLSNSSLSLFTVWHF